MQNTCRIKGCDRPINIKKHELCQAHYVRYVRKGVVEETAIEPRKKHKPYGETVAGLSALASD